MSRVTVFLYGLLCYAVSLVVFVYGFGFIGGFLTPTMLDGPATRPLAASLGIDLAILVVFAIQHSGMARPAFKRWWMRLVPEAAERSTYLLLSCACMGLLFACWQPIGGVLWSVPEGAPRLAIIGLYVIGWLLLLYTTFLIDHFDLFGLTQVWRNLTGQSYRPPRFHTPSLYKAVRHPLYIGWLIIFWAAPVMTLAHLLFAVVTTLYILIAIQLEERDLVSAFGRTYEAYRARTPMLLPRLKAFRRSGIAPESEAQG